MLSQPSLISVIIIICVGLIIYLRKRNFLKRHQQQSQSPKWSISKIGDQSGALHEKIIQGYGVLNLSNQKPESFSYICLEQSSQMTIQTIKNWNFMNLRRLFLGSNSISSVEPLVSMLMPNLQVLVLSNNKITSFKSIRKLQTSNLIWIQIQGNPFHENPNCFTQMNIGSLTYLWIQFFANQRHLSDDMTWLMKCDAASLQKLHANSETRLVCKNFVNTLKKKYTSLDLRLKY